MNKRLVHFFYDLKSKGQADMANAGGGTKAINTSTLYRHRLTTEAQIELLYNTDGPVPKFFLKFSYKSSESLKALIKNSYQFRFF